MLEPIADSAALAAWPLALSVATLAVADRRRAARRRERVRGAMHELRRPLQALVLLAEDRKRRGERGAALRHLELALEALGELERELEEGPRQPPDRWPADARALAIAAARRWEALAARAGRRFELIWDAGEAFLLCDPGSVGRALDNLIANALEHGGGKITLVATRSRTGLRLAVHDEGGREAAAGREARTPVGARPRGRGLAIASAIAAEHGGSFGLHTNGRGCEARIELPLAG